MLCAGLIGCGGSGGDPSSSPTPASTPDTSIDAGSTTEGDTGGTLESDTEITPESDTESTPESDTESTPESDTESTPESDTGSTPEGDTGSTPESDTGSTVGGDTGATALVVQVEDYTTYNDSDSGNAGNSYRNDDVDIEATSDAGGGFNVGWTAAGEWLEYEINLSAGLYAVTTRVASEVSSGSYTLLLDGENNR